MEIKILISTPPGQAKGTEQKLRTFILKQDRPQEIYTNAEDNQIVWIVSGDPRKCLKVQRNVFGFSKLAEAYLNNRMVEAVIKRTGTTKEDYERLKEYFKNTTIETVKEATAEELAQKEDSIFYKIGKILKTKKT